MGLPSCLVPVVLIVIGRDGDKFMELEAVQTHWNIRSTAGPGDMYLSVCHSGPRNQAPVTSWLQDAGWE
jgi:hypothetical protein